MSNYAPPTPVLIAFLVCDYVIQDSLGRKPTLVGIFSNIWVQEFPASHSSSWLYAKLIDCEGDYAIKIEFVRVATQEVLMEGHGNGTSSNRHLNVEIISQLPELSIPAAGEYEFRLWMNDKFIANVRINVDVPTSQ